MAEVNEFPKKKRKPKTQWLLMLGYLLIGAACGVLIMTCLDRLYQDGASGRTLAIHLILLILCMYGAMIIQIVIHEAGHLVFGLATGYHFNSFRIFNLMWLKENGKLRFRQMSVAGTGGQCIMSPPDLKDGKMPVMLYNFGGSILNAITGLIFGGLALLCPAWSFGWVFLMFLVIIGIAYALMNGLPLSAGPVNNDGRNAVDLSGNPEAMRAFWIQMKANEMISKGVRLKDMPEEWFEMPADEAMKNAIIATVSVLACNRLMDEKQFEEADHLMADILSKDNGVIGLYRYLLTCDRMFIELIGKNRREILERMLTKEQKKIMKAMKRFPSVLRTQYAYALLSDRDEEKAATILEQFGKTARTYPYPSEMQGEQELIDIATESAEF